MEPNEQEQQAQNPAPVLIRIHAEGRDLNDNEVMVQEHKDIDTLMDVINAEINVAEAFEYDPQTVLVTMPASFFGGLVFAMSKTMLAFKVRGGTIDELLS